MNWDKKGLIYNAAEHSSGWARNSALTPTPILLNRDVIRVYFGARDESGVSRIRFIDLDANNPSKIIAISNTPALDVGKKGNFDDNGVILGDILEAHGNFYMFYVGFQLVKHVKFLAFSGLAMSVDQGKTFTRVSETPILDRSDEGLYIRAIHTAMFENNTWRIWYSAGSSWTLINDVPYPDYHVKYTESLDPTSFPKQGIKCIECEGTEYRIGRPRVYQHKDQYHLYYTKGNIEGDYLPGFATSKNGLQWHRQDERVGIKTSSHGWDSETLCYPSLLTNASGKTFMFYNGNSMGLDGFGYAEFVDN